MQNTLISSFSPGKEADPSDNTETITVAVKFEADLEISGWVQWLSIWVQKHM